MSSLVITCAILLHVVGGILTAIPDTQDSSCGLPDTLSICSQDCNCCCWLGENGCKQCDLCAHNHTCYKVCSHAKEDKGCQDLWRPKAKDMDPTLQEDPPLEFSKISNNTLDGTTVALLSLDTNFVLIALICVVFAVCAIVQMVRVLICCKREKCRNSTKVPPEVSPDLRTDAQNALLLKPKQRGPTEEANLQFMKTSISAVNEVSEVSQDQSEDSPDRLLMEPEQVNEVSEAFSEVNEVSEAEFRSRENEEDPGTESVNNVQIVETNVEALHSDQRESWHRGKEDLEDGMLCSQDQVPGARCKTRERRKDRVLEKWIKPRQRNKEPERLMVEVSDPAPQGSHLRLNIDFEENKSTDTSRRSDKDAETPVKELYGHGVTSPSSNIAVRNCAQPECVVRINDEQPVSRMKFRDSFNEHDKTLKQVENLYSQGDRKSQASGGAALGVQELQTEAKEEQFQLMCPSMHGNKWIYDKLKLIDWVMGYYSAGESIEVYVNLGSLDPRTVEKQLADITGADITKFHAKQDEEPELDYGL